MDQVEPLRVVYLLVLLAALGGWVLAEYRGRAGLALRSAAAWVFIFLGAAALYGLWGDLRQDLRPTQEMTALGAVALPRAADGHFYAQLTIGGTEVSFLVDTGASGVVLSDRDARRLGIDPEALVYAHSAMTANGPVDTAMLRLRDVALGPFRDAAIAAQVTRGDLGLSLLGMDYLGRFRIEIAGDRMILSR